MTVLESFQTSDVPLAGVDTYLFTSGGVYMNRHQKTDANGQIILNLPEQSYTVRADYLKTQFWSLDFNSQDTTLPITMGDAEIQVSGSDQALSGVKVYAFTAEKSYLGLVGTTDSDGKTTFRLPADEQYTFRADYLGSQYWSNSVTLLPDKVNTVDLSTGGGAFTLTVLKDSETPLTGAKCYVFSSNGAYLGLNETIDANGQGVFRLPDGTYRFRIDHLGYQFWTPNHTIPDTSSGDFTIVHQDVHVTVNGRFQGSDTPISGIRAYLFTAAGAYMGQSGVTDAEGGVSFNLPEQAYKIRADYLAQKYWTGDIVWWDESIEIPMAEARVRVTVGGEPAEGARIYVFNDNGAYLSINAVTDLSGEAVFTLPAGDYTFRADALGQQYWSAVVQLEADQSTVVEIADILTWQTLWGDDGKEQGVNFTTAADGGYVVVGGTDRNANMSTDVLMVKFDERGEALWFQTFGGSKYDEAKSILRADDGGYLIAGYGYPEQSYSSDAYLVKTDAAGTLQWEKFFGGSRSDGAFAISKSDQGYIVAGWTESMGAGDKDMWLFCIDHDGNMLWQKTFGGVDPDIAYDVTQTADGGYVVGGTLGRSEAGPTYTKYYYQGIFIKTDSSGAEQWRSLFGSPLSESKVLSLVETADGGIVGVINGISASSMKALVKLGEGGNEEWTQTFDDPRNFKMQRVAKTADGGLVVAGYVGGGGNDVKIVKADALGNQEWGQLFFGDKSEYAYDIEQTADGGYAIGGASYDLVLRSYDVLLIKTDEDGNVMTD